MDFDNMDQDEAMFGTEVKSKPKKKINLTKWFALGLGGVLDCKGGRNCTSTNNQN